MEPSIAELMQIVKIVLAPAARSPTGGSRRSDRHAQGPAIVLTEGLEEVTAVIGQGLGEVTSCGENIVPGLFAVAAWGFAAFVVGDLHQALFSTAANSLRPATALLHGEGGKHDGGDTKSAPSLVEDRNKWTAVLED